MFVACLAGLTVERLDYGHAALEHVPPLLYTQTHDPAVVAIGSRAKKTASKAHLMNYRGGIAGPFYRLPKRGILARS